ncbi:MULTISPECIES: mannitol-1-phosphate 5-dehydrogenase [unclassified Enterococcus]|uniref:mannitol-1-phosphate 5-dehydrogenase n=1 Tax=unclassified Enterococcus TaxID=2608891 RepID=UPI001557D674|nr:MULTISPECIES: mannitol-1-phosphate 5-dehydrogenase [unclassified Enterococcus]MBS7576153.1 mannitol-1-phosphate 5-dehydrogenase [Enterococcus sp. MMGLQ5-2]MBS7583386.1 mannitol-1-phosphate 5-dehydrogenase [Enterococcus sp. MMGLQ5-1]NPD11246.1 mannitol-1-phosphate 5-dehydrogenase [Enterococcus sp. MMGLQ5-1]NPD35989.1 mannitol-1-phosphate 5-dehydrogenase [Enterococcus sp. MMGLQ5-2]
MKAIHFGAGNIGRGFIGEVLSQNGFEITFVDINSTIIDALKERKSYEVEIADANHQRISVANVDGLNNQTEAAEVVKAIADADLVTTAIGPNILPFIAELIAEGIKTRQAAGNQTPLDVIACENMIGGSEFLFEKVRAFLDDQAQAYVAEYIGFPNAAVDRIVPIQSHEDPLFVSVEPFNEWVIDDSARKAKQISIKGVEYVPDLLPYIERKLFSVNTGHATVAYNGAFYGFKTIDEAIKDERVLTAVKAVLGETGSLVINKWGFDSVKHQAYINKIISRFQNPYISDDITRVARTPIRKLGFDERFIRPIRELKSRDLDYAALLETAAKVFLYRDENDAQAVELAGKLANQDLTAVIMEVTGLEDTELIQEIQTTVEKLK